VKIRYSTEAYNDLVEIIAFGIANFGLAQSNKYVSQIRNAIDLIGLNPEMARLRTELKRPVRIHSVGSHVIVFDKEDGMVVIVRILSAGQNLPDHI
jgi:toxin ParE1/3/4